MKVTMKQIAALSGVSIATVSKVINNKDGKISQETRDRIRRIVKEQGYVANRIASSMVTKRTKTLGLVIPDIANPFFPDLARGVEDGANKLGYTLILCNSDNNLDKEEAYLEMLQEKMVDGIIFTASGGRKMLSPGFKHLLTPVVCVDREIEGLTLEGKIVVDNHRGALEAVSYLLGKDYRKIVHLSGPLTSKTAQDRYRGFLRAHELRGIEPLAEHLYEGTYSSDWGFRATRQLLVSNVDFDCLFCGNDLIALGAYKALHESGKRIPQDIGVIGFDDIYMAQIVTPELTTVRQPAYTMGYEASLMLIKSIRQEKILEKELVLPTELILRGSTR